MTQDSWATAKVWCSLKRIKILKETGKEPLGQIPPNTPEPIVDMSKWTVFSLFSLLITLLILVVDDKKDSVCGGLVYASWCGEKGYWAKRIQSSAEYLSNGQGVAKGVARKSLTKTSTCFKHCFHWCALAASCQTYPALHAPVCIMEE